MASSMNRGLFFGPLRDWSTVAFGPLDNQKEHRKPEIWFLDFFSIYGFFENLGYQNLLFLWYSWISSFFQIYLFNANLHKRRARCDELASERAALVSSSVVAAGLIVVFRFRRFHDRLSSAASDDEEEETRNFWRILRRKKIVCARVFFKIWWAEMKKRKWRILFKCRSISASFCTTLGLTEQIPQFCFALVLLFRTTSISCL